MFRYYPRTHKEKDTIMRNDIKMTWQDRNIICIFCNHLFILFFCQQKILEYLHQGFVEKRENASGLSWTRVLKVDYIKKVHHVINVNK